MAEKPKKILLQELLEARSAAYAFLAMGYRREPTSELFAVLTFSRSPGDGGDSFLASLGALSDAERERLRGELAAEYPALFLNASERAVHPFESVYTSASGRVMQQAREEVLREYREAGMDRAADFHEPEDHLAVECEFMAALCRKALEAFKAGDRAGGLELLRRQEAFLGRHLMVWVPRFCQDLRQATSSAFYLWLATMTAEMLESERDAVPHLIALSTAA